MTPVFAATPADPSTLAPEGLVLFTLLAFTPLLSRRELSNTARFKSMFLCPSSASNACTIDGLTAAARCFIVPTFSLAKGRVLESVLEDEVVDSKLVVDSLRLSPRLEEMRPVSVAFALSCGMLVAGMSLPGDILFKGGPDVTSECCSDLIGPPSEVCSVFKRLWKL